MKVSERLSVTQRVSRSEITAQFGPELEFDRGLAAFTSFGTGGPARYFISAKTVADVARAVKAARKLNLPYFFLGGGTNVLVSDKGFDGLVVKIDVCGMKLVGDDEIISGAGEDLQTLVDFAADNSLSGLEFASGIWGTVGGAIYGNAGAFGGEIGALVAEATLIGDDGAVKTVGHDYCRFGYRDSYLKSTGEAIIEARFKLKSGQAAGIRQKIADIVAARRERHPVERCSAGCFFKNIPDSTQPGGKLPAGRLLDEVGAKGLSVGGAKVFEKHANIIVNTGSATSRDIRKLADILKDKVYERFGVELEQEVIQLGEFQT
jgi:UDP-N-acetylmuramate dehydrogenase